MARKKEFDTELALQQAMNVFWERGYERTSLKNLLDAMNIGRASFYNAYGNKHSLFITVLERYLKQANDDFIIATLDEADSPLAAIMDIFEQEAQHLAADADCKGCLMVNTEVELMQVDDIARERILNSNEAVFRRWRQALADAEAHGEIVPNQDHEALAQHLMNSMRGMKVLGRYSNDSTQFERIANVTIAALNPIER